MNTTKILNDIVGYIEEHIAEDIDMEQIARIAQCSVYDVNRMFSFVAMISISEYIRNRRMTLAGYELKYYDAKVIDVSVKYGYDSPASFSRAFEKFHGLKPNDVKKTDAPIRIFSKMVFQISVKEIAAVIRKDMLKISGKEYGAEYYGEYDMSAWSDSYSKREFWRLDNAYDDFKEKPRTLHVLPYNNYPPIDINIGEVFVIDYHRKDNGQIERRFYISDGTEWNDMLCTAEVMEPIEPVRIEKITLFGKEYEASYFGENDISYWSEKYVKRVFTRIENAYDDFKDRPRTGDVLPYNNYPPIDIKIGEVYMIEYTRKSDGETEKRFYLSDGSVWNDMQCTAEVKVECADE